MKISSVIILSKIHFTNTAMSIFKVDEFKQWVFWLGVQELLFFIMLTEFQTLKSSEGNGLCSSEKHKRARFFPQGRKYYCVKLVYWGCCSLFPVFASKSHLWKKQDCRLKLARGQICYQALWGCASAFILDKFRGRKWVQDWSWPL